MEQSNKFYVYVQSCSLRECLTENESLRLCNQRLEDELSLLRSKNGLGNASPLRRNGGGGEDCHHLMLESLDGVHLYATITTTTVATTTSSSVDEMATRRRTTANSSALTRTDYELDALQIRDLLKDASEVTAATTSTTGTVIAGPSAVVYGKSKIPGDY